MEIINVIKIRQAVDSDLSLLYDLSRRSYAENYADHWNEGGLEWYLEKVYGWDVLKADLANPAIKYFIAFAEDTPAGFIKLRLNSNLPGNDSEKGIELEKIYFRLQFKRKGIGKQLLAVAMQEARRLRKELVWLCVIDTNINAIAFYKKAGFVFHDKTILDIPYFKEELKGMWRMKCVLENNNGN